MAYALQPFADIPLDAALLEHLLTEHRDRRVPRFQRLWNYYRNALADPDRQGRSAGYPGQFIGLPTRFTQRNPKHDDRFAPEIVIENDIAWRIATLVDFMFPTPPRIVSTARTAAKRGEIESLLEAVFEAHGGIELFQNAALLGAVYGHVDFLVHLAPAPSHAARAARHVRGDQPGEAPSKPIATRSASARIANLLLIETVEAPRAIALLNQRDYRVIDAYILHYEQPAHAVQRAGVLERVGAAVAGRTVGPRRATITVTEILSAAHHQRYEDGRLVLDEPNRLGRLPVVHVQNLAQPLAFDGLSDVEPLIPLQDELNTRLSDRANRVTLQSFQMFLGKGIDGFTDRPVGPGQMWLTDNLQASIEAFGGDADSPSERAHIEELREALDKTSGVTPAAAGHIKARVGNLTSENALRISLMGTVAKTKRKRITYAAGIRALCDLILHALDAHGLYTTDPADRGVDIAWTDPLPTDESRRIADALAKAQLGVPLETLRAELGYADDAPAPVGAGE